MSRTVRAEIEIAATPERVWSELSDLETFPDWNPFIRSAEGELRTGRRLRLRLLLGGRVIPLRPRITRVDPPRELRWRAVPGVRGLFDTERCFRIEPTARGVRFVQSEVNTGLLTGLVYRFTEFERHVREGYGRLNRALKARAESSGSERLARRQVAPIDSPDRLHRRQRRRSEMSRKRIAYSSPDTWRSAISSHSGFTHDSIESLGYDWERVADPEMAPRPPLKVYLPRTVEDVVKVVTDAKALGERIVPRNMGHSSNDIAVAEGGSLLLTQNMNRILDFDAASRVVSVEAGAALAKIDDYLAEGGFGLPIIGDHVDISAGGFASVGGVNAASHRYGMFVDNVERIHYVSWDGDVASCSRDEDPDRFFALLTGLGRHGIIVGLDLRVIEVDKYGTVLRNDQTRHRSLDDFIAGSEPSIVSPPDDARYIRGLWAELPKSRGGTIGVGQFSLYRLPRQSPHARARELVAHRILHRIGYLSERVPKKLDVPVKYAGMASLLLPPRYASMKNIEVFTEKIIDSTVGDPTRFLAVLGPVDTYAEQLRDYWRLFADYRDRHKCFTFLSVYVKSIDSPYLAQDQPGRRFCEFVFYPGIDTEVMTEDLLDRLVSDIDDRCVAAGGFRYMHTKTVKDERRRLVDPNTYYAERARLSTAGAAA